jgi:hypothetical protein
MRMIDQGLAPRFVSGLAAPATPGLLRAGQDVPPAGRAVA